MANITFTEGSGLQDSIFGKSQEPIKMFLEKRGEAFEQASMLPELFNISPSNHWGEKFTTIFVNNAIYGMTGGQMAPTTLVGQKATTAPFGRQKDHYGSPLRMTEILATIEGCAYAARVCATDIPQLNKAKKAIQKAFQLQKEGAGFTFVEVLACCPTNWGKTPIAAVDWLKENMMPYYPLGVYKDITAEGKQNDK